MRFLPPHRDAVRIAVALACAALLPPLAAPVPASARSATGLHAAVVADERTDAERVERERVRRSYLEEDRLRQERDDKRLLERQAQRRDRQLRPLQDADRARADRLARLRGRLLEAERCRAAHPAPPKAC